MVCIYCGSDTQVINSRWQKRSNRVWRRRSCPNCQSVITTLEAPDYSASISLRDNTGRLEPFLRDKLFASVHRSLQHRKSAITDATALTDTIMNGLHRCIDSGAVDRTKLVILSTSVLKRFDRAAAVQYAAFHPKGRMEIND